MAAGSSHESRRHLRVGSPLRLGSYVCIARSAHALTCLLQLLANSEQSPVQQYTMPTGTPSATDQKVESEVHPEPSAHHFGQPLKPDLDKYGKQRSKFQTECAEEHAASLQCILDNYDNRSACQTFFDAYKKCRSEENQRVRENNAKGWF